MPSFRCTRASSISTISSRNRPRREPRSRTGRSSLDRSARRDLPASGDRVLPDPDRPDDRARRHARARLDRDRDRLSRRDDDLRLGRLPPHRQPAHPPHRPIRALQIGLGLGGVGVALLALPFFAAPILASFLIGLGYGPSTPAGSDVLQRYAPARHRNLIFSIKQAGVPVGGVL